LAARCKRSITDYHILDRAFQILKRDHLDFYSLNLKRLTQK
jgi:hypothetical protein